LGYDGGEVGGEDLVGFAGLVGGGDDGVAEAMLGGFAEAFPAAGDGRIWLIRLILPKNGQLAPIWLNLTVFLGILVSTYGDRMTDFRETTPSGEIILYESPDGEVSVDVRLEHETVWLSQRNMAAVFATTPENILMHLRNVFASEELSAKATTKDFLVVRTEGKRQVRRRIQHYNLDVIISVGYRVNSKQGVLFRQWATRTLREHLLRGYTLNERRLAERGLDEARQTLDLFARTLENQALVDDAGKTVLRLILQYTETWQLLLQYDQDRLEIPRNAKPSISALDFDAAVAAIKDFKLDFVDKGEASPLFGNQRGNALKAILGNIEQTMSGKPLYRSREEKAANLLYFVVKDHPFTDGNKRIGALLFLLYLKQEGIREALIKSELPCGTRMCRRIR